MNLSTLSTPLTGLAGGAGWARAAGGPSSASHVPDAATAFGFHASGPARTLSVPPSSGETAAQLESRFLAHLFERR
ncbi:MAG: hypothetical protein Q4D74_01290 [Comamonadaceae bacterium]|nr:hypothetical protein [Comamonadaceae bacterium]RRD58322.1 hypothetical protein EII20_03630 [Comamonadaceae bacterium OH2545_COT-014]